MKIETFSYTAQDGWSVEPFPALDSRRTLVLIFSAPEFLDTPEPITKIVKAFPTSYVTGCSTAGEIFGTVMRDNSLAVAAIQFEDTDLNIIAAPVKAAEDSFEAGRTIAEGLKRPNLRNVFILSEGNYVNGSELVRGFNAVLPETVIVTGGLAGDGDRFKRTWVIYGGKPQTELAAAVGFYGDHISIQHGSQGGWDIFGLERTVTRSAGNVLYELDGKPALQLYKDYLGDLAIGLPSSALLFPLALRADASDTTSVVRTVLGVDEATNAMIFAGDIPLGYRARLMRANFDRLIDGASVAATQAQPQPPSSGETLCIAISCVGRRLVLSERVEEELEATMEQLPQNTQQIGFYSYGEISPAGGYCDLHNQTMTITTLCETPS